MDFNDIESRRRFRLNCRLLRNSEKLDIRLDGQRRGESLIDYLVRVGIASDPYAAAEALIVARRMQRQRDDVLQMLNDIPAEQLPEDLRKLLAG